MNYTHADEPVEQVCVQHCPSCGEMADFSYLGAQRWPQRLVELTGIPPVVHLWVCGSCHTTLSEPQVDL